MIWVRRILEVAVIAAIVALIATNMSLQREVKALRAALVSARRTQAGKVFEAGETFEGIGLLDPSGREIVSDQNLPSGFKLVVIVDPACGSCEGAARDVANVRTASAVPPIVISTGNQAQTATFATRWGLDGLVFRVAPATSPTVRRKLIGTPQVLLVSGRRVVRTCTSVTDCLEAAAILRGTLPGEPKSATSHG